MDVRDVREEARRWIAELRLLTERAWSAAAATATSGGATGLPFVFLAVGLLGGLRISDSEMWRAPTLFTLVLGLLMVGALSRHAAFEHSQLLRPPRFTLDRNGWVMVLAVVFASAQVFSLTTPDWPPFRIGAYALYSMVLLALITQAVAADRARLLRGCIVILGTAFLFKFFVLPSPTGGWRAVLCEVLTVGMCEPRHPASGFLALLTLCLYLLALAGLVPMAGDASDRTLAEAGGGFAQVRGETSADPLRAQTDPAGEDV